MSRAETQGGAQLQLRSAAPAGAAPPRPVPVSIFVSRKLRKLFVRQGLKPLFDSPVGIQNPEQPLGTHVFTAMEFENEGTAVRWTAVSMPEEQARMSDASARARTKPVLRPNPPASSPDRANTALDRIDIPQDVVERISGLLTPASSLVVSDQGLGRETGRGTDFIVVTH
jgi:hypothetical protein